MTEQPSDAGLPRTYDVLELVRRQRERLDAEERRVTLQPKLDDPGRDYDVKPPAIDRDDAGHDPLPPPIR